MAKRCPQTGSKHNSQIATTATKTTEYQTTSIEEIFHYELTFIKLCGGYLFERCSLTLRIFYQVSIILMTKFFATNYYSIDTKSAEPIHRASLQNVRLFRITYLVVSAAIVLVNFFTAFKYNRLLLVILKKRLDKRYLNGDFAHIQNNALSIHTRAQFDGSTVTTSNGLTQTDADKRDMEEPTSTIVTVENVVVVHDADKIKEIQPKRPSSFAKARRVRMVSTLLIVNVLSNAFASYLRYNSLDRPMLPGQITSKQSSQPGPITIESTSSTSTTKPSLANNTQLTNGNSIESALTTIMAPLERQVDNSLPNSPLKLADSTPDDQERSSLHETLMLVYRWQSLFTASGFCCKTVRRAAHQALLQLGKLIYEFVRAALNINQTYGQIYIVFMIVATLTDMLSYSRFHDALIEDERFNRISDIHPSRLNRYHPGQSKATNFSGNCKKQSQRTRLLTNELLVQIRDVLIVIRYTSSLNYLGILIFDLTRIGSVFCQFYTAISTESLMSIILLFIQYVLIAFNMSLTGLGYHWLHGEVCNLRRFIDERNLVGCSGANKAGEEYHEQNSYGLSQSERITTCRLADDISNLWPTDWFTPDFRSYLKNNILIITLVATLQQLVEAGVKSRHNGLPPKA